MGRLFYVIEAGLRRLRPGRFLSVLVLALLVAGCGVHVQRPQVDYYFASPILNEQWRPRGFQFSDSATARAQRKTLDSARLAGKDKNRKKKASTRTRKRTRSRKKVARASKPSRKQATKKELVQPLRGPELDVVRREMVLSARRLLGIKDSFTQDTFLRHLLVVNNLGLGKLPRENVVSWLAKRTGEDKTPGTVKPGDVLFLGEKGPELAVIAETVEDDGLVTYIGYWNEEVQRGVLSLKHPGVRRLEGAQKTLNTFIRRGKLAGALLVGGFHLHRVYGGKVASGE